ncbi:MAG: type I pantothenate kinase [Deltaproteobacteria bacterium]|nr:type I pantothenate kinase [Deltaproteobacteria bacterium]
MGEETTHQRTSSAYQTFARAEWSALRAGSKLLLSDAEIDALQGAQEQVSRAELVEVYLPICRLIELRVIASRQLRESRDTFLGVPSTPAPYIIGLAGSVAVGKSTTARVLQSMLSHSTEHPRVELLTTDGFLLPNKVLEGQKILDRKGFPESYDLRSLLQCLMDFKAGKPVVHVPCYSHLHYDVLSGKTQKIERPDIVIIEGLNVLQTRALTKGRSPKWFVSDFFDLSIYVDAPLRLLRRWYVERFLALRATALRNPASYFHRYAELSKRDATVFARGIWRDINEVNLVENILPTRHRAQLVLSKGADHAVGQVSLRRF